MKRLALFFDGTWNDPDDETNVVKLRRAVAARDSDGNEQQVLYDEGVGTGWSDRFRGGVGGHGLSKKVLDAYSWLRDRYRDGDQVYLFGFSRGAYTARSLAGVIIQCGLLREGAALSPGRAYERYRKGREVRPLYELEFARQDGRTDFSAEESELLDSSRRIQIRFIGVWDTVGSLGIPFGDLPGISRRSLQFHNTRMSVIVDTACQALAIDEHRRDYQPTLWSRFIPKNDPPERIREAERRFQDNVEQRWFVGAHSNVGGGYPGNELGRIPLAWIQRRAASAGLGFQQTVQLGAGEHRDAVVDSYARFLRGAYRLFRLGGRFQRPIGAERAEKETGWVEPIHETIDESVFRRWRDDDEYRPEGLRRWAEARGVEVGALKGTQEARLL